MAKLKSLKLKSKEYVFKAFENDQDGAPAKAVFSRFPIHGESFVALDRKSLFDGIDVGKLTGKAAQDAISEKIIDSFMHNLQAGNIDYGRFLDECVDHIDSLEYEGKKVITPADFWKILPPDAAYTIAAELYGYANERDEFTMGEAKA
jgi:hypothetical protein